jgi:hypothetical protein
VVASGLTPLIAAWLVSRNDGHLWWTAGHSVAVAVISLVSMHLLPETRGNDLDEVVEEPQPAASAVPV